MKPEILHEDETDDTEKKPLKIVFSYSTNSRFFKKMTHFCIIFAEKYFLAKYLRFYTSKKNFIKIRPKMSKRKPIKKKLFFTY